MSEAEPTTNTERVMSESEAHENEIAKLESVLSDYLDKMREQQAQIESMRGVVRDMAEGERMLRSGIDRYNKYGKEDTEGRRGMLEGVRLVSQAQRRLMSMVAEDDALAETTTEIELYSQFLRIRNEMGKDDEEAR